MRMLLWKDYRLNRFAFILGGVLLLAPYAVPLSLAVYNDGLPGLTRAYSRGVLWLASAASVVVSQLTLVILAGNAVAAERVDRSTEFLAYLPPSRAKILASKATLLWATALLVWALNMLIAAISPDPERRFELASFFTTVITTGTLLMGGAWLASSLLPNPAYAALIGLLAPLGVLGWFQTANYYFDWPGSEKIRTPDLLTSPFDLFGTGFSW